MSSYAELIKKIRGNKGDKTHRAGNTNLNVVMRGWDKETLKNSFERKLPNRWYLKKLTTDKDH